MDANKVILPNAIMLAEVNALLEEGHTVVIMTKGNSMLPFIRGEKDSVELVRSETVTVGDIALAQIAPGHYVLHRVFAVDGERITLKGDGNLVGVEKCRKSDICGVVLNIIRDNGRQVDCSKKWFVTISRIWRRSPYPVRRYFLAIFRRLPICRQ